MSKATDQTPLDPTAPITLTFEQLQKLLDSRGPVRTMDEEKELIKLQAEATAEATKRAVKPENATHPGISVFSRPGGELANPKGELPFKCEWAGWPTNGEDLKADEFDAMIDVAKSVPSGDYACTRPDGSKIEVKVTNVKQRDTGLTESLTVFFATRGQLRHGLPSMIVMCRELVQGARSTKVA